MCLIEKFVLFCLLLLINLPKFHTIISPLCTSCSCNERIFDCSERNLGKLFESDSWFALIKNIQILEEIRLQYNQISEVPVFPKFNTKIIDLSHNYINFIAKGAFTNLSSLEELNLSNNHLKSSNFEAFTNKLEHLKSLKLSYNALHELPEAFTELFPNINELSLGYNDLEKLNEASMSFANLTVLDLSYNQLKELPTKLFVGTKKLEVLNLSGNLLTKIPRALKYATNLKRLALNDNIFVTIEGFNVFPKLYELEILSMNSMNQLWTVGEGAFCNLPNLVELDLSNCRHLTTIDNNAFNCIEKMDQMAGVLKSKLKILYLNNSNLKSISYNLLANWHSLELIEIGHNPWSCECENQWIMDTLLPLVEKKTPETVLNLVCDHPKELKGQSMKTVAERQPFFKCIDWYRPRPDQEASMLFGAILFGVSSGILISLMMICLCKICHPAIKDHPMEYTIALAHLHI